MTKLLVTISGILATIGLLLAGFQVDIKSQVENVLGAAEVVDNSGCKTAAATSTLGYLTPGTGTSTVTCAIGLDSPRSAVLAIVVNASSTNTQFNGFVEESMDGIDWYPVTVNQSASTTNPYQVATRASFNFQFASTTIGGTAAAASDNRLGAAGTNNRNHSSLEVPVRMKRVRV